MRKTAMVFRVVFVGFASLATAAPAHFEVKSLPGWDGELLSKTYCGFTPAGVPPSGEGAMYFNYIFLESENNPKTDPVIVWVCPCPCTLHPPRWRLPMTISRIGLCGPEISCTLHLPRYHHPCAV